LGLLDYKSYIIERKMSLTADKFSILNDSREEIGKVEGKLISLTGEFNIMDATGNTVGRIKGKLSIRPTFNFYDHENNLIATAKRKMINTVGGEYWVENPQGEKILEAAGDFTGQEYKIRNEKGEIVAEISEKISQLKDAYLVKIHNEINPLIILALTISIDYYENKKKQLELITGFNE